MGLIIKLSLRNLLRQKRRSFLLGMGIALGMMILTIANSFAHGMVDVLINEVVAKAFGHLVIDSKPGNSGYSIIRDQARIEKLVKATIPRGDLLALNENLQMFGRAVGNGETDNIVVVGVSLGNPRKRAAFFQEFLARVAGDYREFFSSNIEYPVVISAAQAKSLNVKVHDGIRVAMPMVTGQIQAAKLTVVAIANTNNTFMNQVLFMEGRRVKRLLGYKPWEAASLQITLKDPEKTAIRYADLLHQKLVPRVIALSGKIAGQAVAVPGTLFAYKNAPEAIRGLDKRIRIVQGERRDAFARSGVMLSEELARKLKVQASETIVYRYATQYRGESEVKLRVAALYRGSSNLGGAVVLVNEERVHDQLDRYLPATVAWINVAHSDPFFPLLATEWKLFERSADGDALDAKYRKDQEIKTHQAKFDVITMYEGASGILKLEGVMNLITLVAVLILFFIILIGVMNTLRMTIRERTSEIGTVRAIGMQKSDVRNMFVLETVLLTVFASLSGIGLGILATLILGAIPFQLNDSLSMILKDRHLVFKMNPGALFSNLVLIIGLAGVTAFFPARRAARLTAVEALRHHE